MPPRLRAGGYYVAEPGLGAGWWEKSALAMMQIPILHSRDRQLAAQRLLDAGTAAKAFSREESLGLYRELLKGYPESPRVAGTTSPAQPASRRGGGKVGMKRAEGSAGLLPLKTEN